MATFSPGPSEPQGTITYGNTALDICVIAVCACTYSNGFNLTVAFFNNLQLGKQESRALTTVSSSLLH